MFDQLQHIVDRALWSSRAEESVLIGLLRRLARYPYAIVRDAVEGQLTMRAMSLVYTTLLSVVPLIALSFSVLKAFDVHHMAEPVISSFLQPLGSDQASELTGKVTEFVDNVRGLALGGPSLLLLLYTVISMVQKVEESLNYVWQVERSRSFARRFSEYLSVLLIAPILMLMATATVGAVSSNSLVEKLEGMIFIGSTLSLAGKLVPLAMVSIVFTFIYALLPNTRVRPRAALTGGVCAGLMWVMVGALFASFVAGSTNYTAIYTTFAAVIVALLWLYANWLILLVGAKVSFYVQHPELLRYGHRRLTLGGSLEERSAVQGMLIVARAFTDGTTPPSTSDLANELGVPGRALAPVLEQLEARGLLVITEKDHVLPARALHAISVYDVLEAIRDQPDAVPLACANGLDQTYEVVTNVLHDVDEARARSTRTVDFQTLVARTVSPPAG
ncbi:MAG: YhjD/YihY/BrkB family envelope integrity protein [Pseudomonadota bacterium]